MIILPLQQYRPYLILCVLLISIVGCAQETSPSVNEVLQTRSAEVAPATATATVEPTATATVLPPTTTPVPTKSAINSENAVVATAEPTTMPTAEATQIATVYSEIEGALIALSMESSVGVLLDGLPADVREQMAEEWLNAPESVWEARAERQARLARLRLNFRDFHVEDKGQLPMPPDELWTIELDPAGPVVQTIQGHELVMHAYTFKSMLLTDAASVIDSEPALVEIGGTWEEPFIFPADPDHLIQRTGNACINEAGFPANSYDAVNAWHFYDYTCTADSGGELGCHRSSLPLLSCVEAIEGRIGEVSASMQFERLPWDDALASSVRMGDVTTTEGPDLVTLTDDMHNNRIIYRWFSAEDCAFIEGATGGSGWRRLLLFDATVHNTGTTAMHMGKANAEDDVNNVFTFAPCHGHFHYSNYGDFFIRGQFGLTGGKQAFCVQSTNRQSNNETSPLTHNYTCSFQGIQAGWVDEYIAGLDAQWVDITNIEIPVDGESIELGFASNRDKFMCEGTPITDDAGVQLWEPSDFVTVDGHGINRPQCDFVDDWDVNNVSVLPILVPESGGYVTEPCLENEMGPLRNCGFRTIQLDDDVVSCSAGDSVTLPLDRVDTEGDLVVRVCERSALLGDLTCERRDAVTNVMRASSAESITFTCPAVRDADDGSGGFTLLAAPLFDGLDGE